MDIFFQRKIDRIAGTIICGIFSLFPINLINTSKNIKSNKILIILLSEMGSLVLARPMFDYIRKRYPYASVHVLLFKKNVELMELLDIIPSNNILTVRDSSFMKFFKDSVNVVLRMRKIGIDTIIDCELFSRISSIYSFLSGAAIRAGFHPHTQEGLFRGSFINRPVLYNPYHHISKQFVNLVKAIESDLIPTVKCLIEEETFPIPRLEISRSELNEMQERLLADFPQIMDKKLVLIYPGGGLLPIRAWPLDYFNILADDLLENDYAIGIIGMYSDAGLADEIISHCQSRLCINLTGYTKSIKELMIMFQFSSLLIANDGGPGHFASMTPVPAIILYGPETPTLYGTLDEKDVNIYNPLSCSPCLTAYNHRNSPCDGDNICLKLIHPKEVIRKAHKILGT